jgi:hypothetical protein
MRRSREFPGWLLHNNGPSMLKISFCSPETSESGSSMFGGAGNELRDHLSRDFDL